MIYVLGGNVVHQDKLSSVLGDFARTMLIDFPIQGILDHLVERIVEILPITGAGVTLVSPGMAPRHVAASDDVTLRFEQLQTELGQGPCLTAFASGQAVLLPDLAADHRYPVFGPAAVAAGMGAVFAFPLPHGDGRLGALDLYRDTPGALSPQARAAAQTLADVTAAYLINAQSREEALQAAELFRYRSLHDALTGLPNRVLLLERLEHASQRAKRTHKAVAVLFVDLDHFKRVNDDYGHGVGDELLIAVADRMSGLVRPGDTLARVSGDEFVFLCDDLDSAGDVDLFVDRIEEAFTTPFDLVTVEVAATASVGIAYAGPGETVTEALVLDADTAMYQAKRRGGGAHQMIDLRVAATTHDRHQLERDLRTATANAQLHVAYQPIVRTADESLTGVEALLRWTRPDRGLVSPTIAIAVAEQSELIIQIGEWVLQRACRDWATWRTEHPGNRLDLSVNVSPRQLLAPGFVAIVRAVLDATGMDPTALVLELTESMLVDVSDRAMRVLGDLKSLGIRLALDDFGTGYCSLSYLRELPVDIIKIDRSFVADLGLDTTASAIAASVTNLAHLLDMIVTAEGVETKEQHEQVVGLGCDLAQGFLYDRPMTAPDLSTLLSLTNA
jgi:diguanylate cyclase (GGDEF)-like protein